MSHRVCLNIVIQVPRALPPSMHGVDTRVEKRVGIMRTDKALEACIDTEDHGVSIHVV